MRLVFPLLIVAALLAGCNNVSDTTGSTPQTTTPASPSTPGDSPASTGQNSPGTYGADSRSATSHPGTDAARP